MKYSEIVKFYSIDEPNMTAARASHTKDDLHLKKKK